MKSKSKTKRNKKRDWNKWRKKNELKTTATQIFNQFYTFSLRVHEIVISKWDGWYSPTCIIVARNAGKSIWNSAFWVAKQSEWKLERYHIVSLSLSLYIMCLIAEVEASKRMCNRIRVQRHFILLLYYMFSLIIKHLISTEKKINGISMWK